MLLGWVTVQLFISPVSKVIQLQLIIILFGKGLKNVVTSFHKDFLSGAPLLGTFFQISSIKFLAKAVVIADNLLAEGQIDQGEC